MPDMDLAPNLENVSIVQPLPFVEGLTNTDLYPAASLPERQEAVHGGSAEDFLSSDVRP